MLSSKLSTRQLRFPEGFSLGRVYISDNYVRERFVGEARGVIVVPGNRKVTLRLNEQGVAKSGTLECLDAAAVDYLSLEHTHATDELLEPLFRFTSVQRLSLQFTKIEGSSFENLHRFKNLNRVSAWWSRLRDVGLGHLIGIESLETLDISRTNITDEGICAVAEAGAPGLRVLVIQNNQITDKSTAALARLSALRELHIGDTRITDESIQSLSRMLSLTVLNVGQTLLTSSGVTRLKAALPNCQVQYDEEFAQQQGGTGCRLT